MTADVAGACDADPQAEVERLRAELAEERRRSAELQEFLDQAAEGVHMVGPDGTILWANAAELCMLGYEAHEYIGHNIAEFHADRHTVDDFLARLLKGETLRSRAARLRCKDGSIKHVAVSSSGMFRGGDFVHSRCFTRDVTPEREAA